ncbi:MAG: hypothetical protein KAG80_09750, partial [Nocardioides sp.]|nr:hypothetical protein [Nocardioides sp.]
MTYRVEQTTDPVAFLALAGEHLAADPVLSTVVSTTLGRAVDDPQVPEHPRWWAAVLDGEQVVGVGMRTAPFRPYPLYLLPMPEDAARALGRHLVATGED